MTGPTTFSERELPGGLLAVRPTAPRDNGQRTDGGTLAATKRLLLAYCCSVLTHAILARRASLLAPISGLRTDQSSLGCRSHNQFGGWMAAVGNHKLLQSIINHHPTLFFTTTTLTQSPPTPPPLTGSKRSKAIVVMAEHDLLHKVSPFCDPHLLVQAEGPLDFLHGQAEYFPENDILSAKVALLGQTKNVRGRALGLPRGLWMDGWCVPPPGRSIDPSPILIHNVSQPPSPNRWTGSCGRWRSSTATTSSRPRVRTHTYTHNRLGRMGSVVEISHPVIVAVPITSSSRRAAEAQGGAGRAGGGAPGGGGGRP